MLKKRVLIIDDDARNIFALNATLKAKGFDCVACDNASDAISMLVNKEPVSIVLMDMMMPDMDGYEAIPVIKQIDQESPVPVIAVTAQAMQGDREKCLRAGADEYISKPVDVDRLLLLLDEYIK